MNRREVTGNGETDLLQMGRRTKREERGKRREGNLKRTKICYGHVPAPRGECGHYALRTRANKN